MTQEHHAATPVDQLSADELQSELGRTRAAFAEYVKRVGAVPEEAAADLPPDARRHLEVQEAIDRKTGGTALPEFVAEMP